ncbi:MAG: glycosyltransferase [Deltaproteobacteria bacterium]|nr:MAG: glycosyltransferase [Deltaproteobacteria bacterium]
MKFSTWMIVLVTIGVNLLIWTTINKPYNTVETSYPINSVSFNPYKKNQSPYTTPEISPEQLEEDLKAVEGKARTIRLYSSMNGLDRVPELAKEHNIQVVASAFIDDRQGDEKNDEDVLRTIELAGKNKNVSRVIIGNETQLHKTVPVEKLKAYLQMARKKLKTPVSTAEPWDFWIQHPDFVDEVDYIAIHILPYWVEVPIDQAVDYVVGKYLAVKNMFPKKYVYIAETGWPSDGPQRGAAEATLKNQADFVRRFVQRAEEEKIPYNIIEAFDQPWKSVTEGNVGEHWGLMDADRHDKFPLQGPVLEDPKWKYWAISSSVLGFLGTAVFLSRRRDLKKRGQFISMAVFQGLAAFSTQMARQASNQYMSPGDIVFWGVMITAHFLLAILMVTDAMEIADVVGDKPLKRKFLPSNVELEHWPFVSLHVACCNEPPDMMIQTVDSLASLDYPNYEIMVIDNNTMDPAVWKPLQEHCATLGDKVRFLLWENILVLKPVL